MPKACFFTAWSAGYFNYNVDNFTRAGLSLPRKYYRLGIDHDFGGRPVDFLINRRKGWLSHALEPQCQKAFLMP